MVISWKIVNAVKHTLFLNRLTIEYYKDDLHVHTGTFDVAFDASVDKVRREVSAIAFDMRDALAAKRDDLSALVGIEGIEQAQPSEEIGNSLQPLVYHINVPSRGARVEGFDK